MKLWHYPLYRVNGGYPTDCDCTGRAPSRREAVFALRSALLAPSPCLTGSIMLHSFGSAGTGLTESNETGTFGELVMDFRDSEQVSASDVATVIDEVVETVADKKKASVPTEPA